MPQSPREFRQDIRADRLQGLTTGLAPGYVQANLAIVPSAYAGDFVAFCRANARACPVIAVGAPGDPCLPSLGADLDVRTDLPAYLVSSRPTCGHNRGHFGALAGRPRRGGDRLLVCPAACRRPIAPCRTWHSGAAVPHQFADDRRRCFRRPARRLIAPVPTRSDSDCQRGDELLSARAWRTHS